METAEEREQRITHVLMCTFPHAQICTLTHTRACTLTCHIIVHDVSCLCYQNEDQRSSDCNTNKGSVKSFSTQEAIRTISLYFYMQMVDHSYTELKIQFKISYSHLVFKIKAQK